MRLALVGGLPGTGKTTVGGALADRFGAVLLSSDRLRKELAGLDPADARLRRLRRGALQPGRAPTSCTRELLHRAGALLARGESVVLDASWTRRAAPCGRRGAGPARAQRPRPPALARRRRRSTRRRFGHAAAHGIGRDRRDRHRPGRDRRSMARGPGRPDDRLRR